MKIVQSVFRMISSFLTLCVIRSLLSGFNCRKVMGQNIPYISEEEVTELERNILDIERDSKGREASTIQSKSS